MSEILRLGIGQSSQLDQNPLQNLPSPETRYWLPRHKAAVVAAVRSGFLTIDEACERYMLSEEELQTWTASLDQNGVVGLRATLRERRRIPRQVVSEPATAALFADVTVDCIIVNISDVGARLRFNGSTLLPWIFELRCNKSERSWLVSPVWQSEKAAGVRFNNPLHPPWTIKSGLADWLLGKRSTVSIERIDR